MSEFSNFKGMFFELCVERFLTADQTSSFEVKHLNSTEVSTEVSSEVSSDKQPNDGKPKVLKKPNYAKNKKRSPVGRGFDKILQTNEGENYFWILEKKHACVDYMTFNRKDKVIELFQATTSCNHSLKWTDKIDNRVSIIDPLGDFKINLYFTVVKCRFDILNRDNIGSENCSKSDNNYKRINIYSLLVKELTTRTNSVVTF